MDTFERVHFYSTSDLSLKWQIPRIDKLISRKHTWSTFTDINDVIELYETQKVLETGVKEYQDIDEILSSIKTVLNKYYSRIDPSNISDVLLQVDTSYKDDFWELFVLFKAYQRISAESFEKLMKNEAFDIVNVLHQKRLTDQYDSDVSVRRYSPFCASLN